MADLSPWVRSVVLSDKRSGLAGAPWALLILALATGLRLYLDPWVSGAPFLTYFPAVLLATVCLGWRWGAFVLALSLLVANYIFQRPFMALALGPKDIGASAGFLLLGGLMLLTAQALRNAVQSLEEAARRERLWREREEAISAELQHRTRNLLAVVSSISDQTLNASADLESFQTAFRGRLSALSRVQGLLSRREEDRRVTFDELLDAEVSALFGPSARVTLAGPRGIALRSSKVQTLALVLHELGVNALKHGALSQAGADVTIKWRLGACETSSPKSCGKLDIEWIESGLCIPQDARGKSSNGLGRRFIEMAIPYQLNGSSTFEMREEGLRCTISIPVPEDRTEGSIL